jgi:hypothetical protein
VAKRLQVILRDPEYREIRRSARSRHMTIAEWVRQQLASACRQEPIRAIDKKLDVLRAAMRHEFPVAELDTMLAEIEAGYRNGSGE